MPDFDNPVLDRLAAAGLPLAELNEDQRQVLGSMSDEEVALLLGLKARLDAIEPEVQAHTSLAGGALF